MDDHHLGYIKKILKRTLNYRADSFGSNLIHQSLGEYSAAVATATREKLQGRKRGGGGGGGV